MIRSGASILWKTLMPPLHKPITSQSIRLDYVNTWRIFCREVTYLSSLSGCLRSPQNKAAWSINFATIYPSVVSWQIWRDRGKMRRLIIFAVLVIAVSVEAADPFPGASQPCYDTESGGKQGWCEHDNCCEGSLYISNLCPDYPNQVKL